MIALIGGTGGVPAALAAQLRAQGRDYLLCQVDGFPLEVPGDAPRLHFRMERLGTLLAALAIRGATEACLVGAVRRPVLDPAQVDAATRPLVPRLRRAMGQGDDGALRALVAIFEEAGLAIRGAHELAPDLLPPSGVLSDAEPTARHQADAARAARAHRVMAPADVGQALVVRDGQVLAVEAAPGTDWMIDSLARDGLGGGALLYKAPKAGQDRRVDLPVIGPVTMGRAAAAGLSAVVVEAGGVLLLDRAASVAAADAGGLVLWVREPDP